LELSNYVQLFFENVFENDIMTFTNEEKAHRPLAFGSALQIFIFKAAMGGEKNKGSI
jgi:hypothetical protein